MKTVLALLCLVALAAGQCPVEDPKHLPAGPINITVAENPEKNILVIEVGSVHGGSDAEGHSSLVTDIKYNALTQVITFAVDLPAVQIAGVGVDAWGEILSAPFRPITIPNGPFTAKGSFSASVANLHAHGTVGILVNLITNRVTCRYINVDAVSFDSVVINDLELVSGGSAVDWAVWNAGIKDNFMADWAAGKAEILERVKVPVDDWLKDMTLAELLELILPKPPTPCTTELPMKK